MQSTTPVRKYLIAGSLCLTLSPAMFGQTHKAPPTDWQIEAQVQKAIANDHIFVGSSIMSSVDKGVVKLTGIVRSEREKEYASSDLANIPGVKTVLNNLEVHENSFHPAPAPAKVAGPTGPKTITLAAGTVIPVRLNDEINTKTAQAGDTFHATTASNVAFAGFTAIPSGTVVTGRIVEAKAAGRLSGAAVLGVELVSIKLPNGTAAPEEMSLVTQELSNKAQGRGTNTAEKAGGGAAFGAVVGALAGGGAGAGIGAASGGALGLGANVLTHGKEIDLKPEQLLQFRTAAPLGVKIMLVDGQQIVPQATSPAPLQARPEPPGAQ